MEIKRIFVKLAITLWNSNDGLRINFKEVEHMELDRKSSWLMFSIKIALVGCTIALAIYHVSIYS